MRHILVLIFLSCLFSSYSYADPPHSVSRLSYIQGVVSFSPANARDNFWIPAKINRPLVAGDRLWADRGARAELQLGSAAVRIEDEASIRILNLNDHIAQFDLSQGTLALQVRRMTSSQIYEINTPQLAFKVTQPGSYRIDVSDDGESTTVTVWRGKGTVYTKNSAYKIKKPGSYRYANQHLRQLKLYSIDTFDRWSLARETRITRSRSAQYVSTSLIGYEELDAYGSWRHTSEYGNVWMPNRVSSGYVPYRHGNWSWVDPWGWTWIDDEPWGFATSHYGRWANYNNTWVWIPGRKAAQVTYAPALVAFIGGNGFELNLSIGGSNNPGIGWFPLGPRDVYVPPYAVSQQYFSNINSNNTTINQTQITNIYNNPAAQPVYTYQQVPNAVTAVPKNVFVESAPTAPAAVAVSTTVINQAPASTTTPAAPAPENIAPPSTTAAKPSEDTLDRIPIVVTPPPPSTVSDNTGEPKDGKDVTPVEQVAPPSDTAIPDAATVPAEAPASSDQVPPDKTQGPDSAPPVKAAADKAEIDKAEAATERERLDKAADASADADKAAAEKVEIDKAAADKAASDKVNTEKAAMDHAATAKAETDKAEAESAEIEKIAAAKATADKEASDKAASEKIAIDNAAADAEANRVAAERAEANRAAESAKALAAQEAASRAEADRAAADAQVKNERAAASKEKADRAADSAKAQAAQEAASSAEADRAAADAKMESERAAASKAKADRAAESAKAQAAQEAASRAEADRAAADAQMEHERAAASKAKADRAAASANAEAEQAAAEKADAESAADAERAATAAQAEADRAATEKAEAERAAATNDAPPAVTPSLPTSDPE